MNFRSIGGDTTGNDVGYSVLTGSTTPADANGLSATANLGGFNLLSNDSALDQFNSRT